LEEDRWREAGSGNQFGATMNDTRIVTPRLDAAVQKRRDELK
jgi:hypothetical protein